MKRMLPRNITNVLLRCFIRERFNFMRILNTVRAPLEARVKRETPRPLVGDAKYTSVSYDSHLVSNYPGFRNFIIIIFSFNPDAVLAPTVICSPVFSVRQPRLRRQSWRRRYRFGNRRPLVAAPLTGHDRGCRVYNEKSNASGIRRRLNCSDVNGGRFRGRRCSRFFTE